MNWSRTAAVRHQFVDAAAMKDGIACTLEDFCPNKHVPRRQSVSWAQSVMYEVIIDRPFPSLLLCA